jgi:hypothetical protein
MIALLVGIVLFIVWFAGFVFFWVIQEAFNTSNEKTTQRIIISSALWPFTVVYELVKSLWERSQR